MKGYSNKTCCGNRMKRVRKKINGVYENYIKCVVCGNESYDEISLKRNENKEKREKRWTHLITLRKDS